MLTEELNSRVKFPEGKQNKFLKGALSVLDIKTSELAAISGVCNRTLRDWRKEKYNMDFISLEKIGIKKGNKIVNQVDIPQWILDSKKCKIACLKGLMDTDGGFYYHTYGVNGKKYTYLRMCFTSYSRPLLKSVINILSEFNLNPKNTARNRVYLYKLSELVKYVEIVGTNNPRYLDVYNNFFINRN